MKKLKNKIKKLKEKLPNGNLNDFGTYEVVDENGLVVETFRIKMSAEEWLRHQSAPLKSTLKIRRAKW